MPWRMEADNYNSSKQWWKEEEKFSLSPLLKVYVLSLLVKLLNLAEYCASESFEEVRE